MTDDLTRNQTFKTNSISDRGFEFLSPNVLLENGSAGKVSYCGNISTDPSSRNLQIVPSTADVVI